MKRLNPSPPDPLSERASGTPAHTAGGSQRLAGMPVYRTLLRYGFAVVAVAAAMGLRLALTAAFGPGLPAYITFYPMVMAVAVLAGFGPGTAATALSSVVAAYWILPSAASPIDRVGLVIFVSMGLFVSVIAELYRRSRDKAAAFDREAAARASLEQLRLLRTALEAAANAIAITDRQGTLQWVNPAFTTLTGYSADEVLGQNPRLLKSGEQAPDFYRQMWDTILGGTMWQGEIVNRRKDGAHYTEEMTITPVRAADGEITHFIAMKQDVTERRQADDRLRATLKEVSDLRAALDEHAIVAITDPRGRITFVNDKFCAISKYSREELLGQDHRIVNSGFHPKAFIRELWTTIAHGRVWHGDIRNRAKDGSIYWVDTTIVPFLDAQGKPRQYVAIRADITERKQAEERVRQINQELEQRVAARVAELAAKASLLAERNAEIEQAHRALEEKAAELALTSKYKSEFLANMSHELRTPLNSMLMLAHLLAENYQGNLTAKQVEHANIIVGSGYDLLELINDILDLAAIEAGKLSKHPASTLISAIGEDLEKKFRQPAVEKGLRLSLTLAPDLPPTILTDSKRLQQILRNLLGNALKFTQTGEVGLSIRRAGDEIAFAVTDTGIGIPADQLESIFEAFHQVDGSLTRSYSGTGLGLSICRQLSALLGGRMTVESRIGAGSCFTLFLPDGQVPAKAAPASIAGRSNGPVALAGRRVLVVDDDRRNLLAMLGVLEQAGLSVTTASSGEDALAALAWRPNVVLLDIMMPDMDGYAVLARIRDADRHARLPVVAVTADAMLGDREKILAAGFDAYLAKPVVANELVMLLGKLLSADTG